jgi:predicted nucleotidyltransferase
MDNFGLSARTIDLINKLFASFSEIEKVVIFGSRARGNFKPASDIDLAIYGEISDKLLRHIAFELEELPTPYKFDVLNYNDIDNIQLKQNIDKDGKAFYKIS